MVPIDSDRAVAASIAGTEMPGYIQSFAIFGTLHDYPLQAGAFYGILQDEDMKFQVNEQSTGNHLGIFETIEEAVAARQRHHDSIH